VEEDNVRRLAGHGDGFATAASVSVMPNGCVSAIFTPIVRFTVAEALQFDRHLVVAGRRKE
jgi:hypothetical protein